MMQKTSSSTSATGSAGRVEDYHAWCCTQADHAAHAPPPGSDVCHDGRILGLLVALASDRRGHGDQLHPAVTRRACKQPHAADHLLCHRHLHRSRQPAARPRHAARAQDHRPDARREQPGRHLRVLHSRANARRDAHRGGAGQPRPVHLSLHAVRPRRLLLHLGRRLPHDRMVPAPQLVGAPALRVSRGRARLSHRNRRAVGPWGDAIPARRRAAARRPARPAGSFLARRRRLQRAGAAAPERRRRALPRATAPHRSQVGGGAPPTAQGGPRRAHRVGQHGLDRLGHQQQWRGGGILQPFPR